MLKLNTVIICSNHDSKDLVHVTKNFIEIAKGWWEEIRELATFYKALNKNFYILVGKELMDSFNPC